MIPLSSLSIPVCRPAASVGFRVGLLRLLFTSECLIAMPSSAKQWTGKDAKFISFRIWRYPAEIVIFVLNDIL